MGLNLKKVTAGGYVAVLFFALLAVFTIFRQTIGDYAASLLALTREVTISKDKDGEAAPRLKITTNVKVVSPVKRNTVIKKKSTLKTSKPVTVKLPKTDTPEIVITDGYPDWMNSGYPVFPLLRNYKGTKWNKEKTLFKVSSDGKKLYFICRLFDKEPNKAVTKFTEGKGGRNAWRDDSIEIFLMKNSKSRVYCQYIISVSGAGTVLCHENSSRVNSVKSAKIPKGFIRPVFDVTQFKGGFEIELRVYLSNIGIDKLKPGDSFLIQVVRNYRGQGGKDSVTLQLFPVYIYADSRLGTNNHDRRAFQPVKVTALQQ